MDESQQFERLLKRWVAGVPSPQRGRAALLRSAARLNQPKAITLAWFDHPGVYHPMERELSMFTWATVGNLQPRLSGIFLAA